MAFAAQATAEVGRDGAWSALAGELDVPAGPAPIRRWVQSSNGGHLAGLVWGQAPAGLVLVHDLGDSADGWDLVSLALQRPLVAVDLPGHGRSSSTDGRVQAPARSAAALVDAVHSLAPAALVVVATGYGAAVALHAARRRPAAIRAVVVVDGGPIVSGIGPPDDDERFADPSAAVARLAAQAPRRSQLFNRHLVAETTLVADDGELRWRSQLASDAAAEWQLASSDVAGILDGVTVPVGVLTAAPAAPLDPVAAAVAARWPQRLRGIPGAASSDLLGSSPVALAAAISDLVAELTEDGAE